MVVVDAATVVAASPAVRTAVGGATSVDATVAGGSVVPNATVVRVEACARGAWVAAGGAGEACGGFVRGAPAVVAARLIATLGTTDAFSVGSGLGGGADDVTADAVLPDAAAPGAPTPTAHAAVAASDTVKSTDAVGPRFVPADRFVARLRIPGQASHAATLASVHSAPPVRGQRWCTGHE